MSVAKPAHTEEEAPSQYPFQQPTGDLFPPICIKSHWDPTAILRHTLPDRQVTLPLDFRPWQRVCKSYRTSGPTELAPMPPKDMVFPQGGEFYPPGRYSASIDKESVLRTLDHPLDRYCPQRQYQVSPDSNMYTPNYTVVRKDTPMSSMVQELAMPRAVLRESGYHCRSANDDKLWERSPRLFNNPTKQDKFGSQTYYALPGGVLEYSHGDTIVPPLTQQAKEAIGGPSTPPGGFTSKAHQGIQPIYSKPPPKAKFAEPVGTTTVGWQAPA